MSLGEIGWAICLVGLPVSLFIFKPQMDMWHAQTAWMQLWVAILWTYRLGKGSERKVADQPLAWLLAWTLIWVWWTFYQDVMGHKTYTIKLLLPLLNWLTVFACLHTAMHDWTPKFIRFVLDGMGLVGVLVMGLALLQLANLDPFFEPKDWRLRDEFVGTVANPSHFGAYLALLLPIYLMQEKKIWWAAGVLCAIELYLTHSMAAWAGAGIATVFCLWVRYRPAAIALLCLAPVAGCHLTSIDLNPHGRIEAWQRFWQLFEVNPVMGLGPGAVHEFISQIKSGPIFNWGHVHNEYFQLAIEQGLIGLGLFCWILWNKVKQAWHVPKSNEAVTLIAIGLVFLINALINFPAHLWHLGMFAVVAYAGLEVLTVKDI